jgi:hypothetical protein
VRRRKGKNKGLINKPVEEHGATLIEAALVIPILLGLLFISVDLGRWLLVYQSLAHVTSESARVAASTPGITAGSTMPFGVGVPEDLTSKVRTLMSRAGFSDTGWSGTVTRTGVEADGIPANSIIINITVTDFTSIGKFPSLISMALGSPRARSLGPYLFP